MTATLAQDLEIVAQQLGRTPRGVVEISYRTPDGQPAVVKTRPRLEDGTPFPTLFYLTEPRLTAAASKLEANHVMEYLNELLSGSAELQADYQAAHEWYLATRNEMEDLGTDFSGGGMPERVKCIHVLVAYALSTSADHCKMCTIAVALCAAADPTLLGAAIPADWPALADFGIDFAEVCTRCNMQL